MEMSAGVLKSKRLSMLRELMLSHAHGLPDDKKRFPGQVLMVVAEKEAANATRIYVLAMGSHIYDSRTLGSSAIYIPLPHGHCAIDVRIPNTWS